MPSHQDSFGKIIVVALVICLVCSVIVSFTAVKLKPLQQTNKRLDKQTNILSVAGIDTHGRSAEDIANLFEDNIEVRIVELATGEFTDKVSAEAYDQRKAAKDPEQNVLLNPRKDIAKIKRRARYAPVYLVKEAGQIKRYILPLHGYGLWSTLYGFIAIEPDATTIYGLSFYEHAETPGLGGEVDNPKWKSQWRGKHIFDKSDNLAIEVVKYGQYNPADETDVAYTVDGLAGASLTTQGVHNLVRYWMSDAGFGLFLKKLQDNG